MRRASAISLLAAICFSLIADATLADSESTLPACCRRAGAHHCTMAGDEPGADPGAPVATIRENCSCCPLAPAAPVSLDAALLKTPAAIFAAVVSHPSLHFQTEARRRVSLRGSRQKRGPPALLS